MTWDWNDPGRRLRCPEPTQVRLNFPSGREFKRFTELAQTAGATLRMDDDSNGPFWVDELEEDDA